MPIQETVFLPLPCCQKKKDVSSVQNPFKQLENSDIEIEIK